MGRPNGSDGRTSRGSRPLRRGAGSDPRGLLVTLPALPETSALIRERVRAWLDSLSWPADEREDVIAATSEAVENVIDHAYLPSEPGDVEVDGRVEEASAGTRRVLLTVTDSGRWRRRAVLPDNRGRGFTIMRACMADVRVQPGERGTRVELRSRPVAR
jgi:serine/threonine-protein kinase RsbW